MSGTIVIIDPTGTEFTLAYPQRTCPIEPLNKAVGGYVERVKVRWNGRIRDAYVNEEGLVHRLPYNERASELVRQARSVDAIIILGAPHIVGPIAIVVSDPRKKAS